MTLASPVEIAGHPKSEWGPAQDFRIRLLAFQDPDNTATYCASLQGTPEFFGELDEVLDKGGTQAIRDTLQVHKSFHVYGCANFCVSGCESAIVCNVQQSGADKGVDSAGFVYESPTAILA